jgi:hypothetical protein
MPPSPRLRLLYDVERGIFLPRRRLPGLARRGRAARAPARLLRAGGLWGVFFLLVCSSISCLDQQMCVFGVSCGRSRSVLVRWSGPARRGPKCSRPGGAPEICRATICPNVRSCMLPWFMTFAQGMFLRTHHLVCGCCMTLSVAYFCPAAGRRGWPAGAGRRGLRHGCCGLGSLGACVFF